MSEINKSYFENLLANKRISMRALADRMGMSHSQLSVTFSGKRRMQLEEAVTLSEIFGEPLTRIIEASGVPVGPVSGARLTVVGAAIGDGTVSHIDETQAPSVGVPELPEDAIAIQCRTSESALAWMDGWILFCSKPSGVHGDSLGRFCFLKIKDGPAVLATIKRGYEEGTVNLSGPYSAENVRIEWATPIIATKN
jgi:transcriptional regulator with XRE-family HTH domain